VTKLQKEKFKLEKVLGGIQTMRSLPSVIFVVDPGREHIAVNEAKKLKIPIVAIVDTNCDPDNIDFIIPGNDDAIRAIKLFASKIADAVLEGRKRYEERLAAEADKEDAGEVEEMKPEENDVPVNIEADEVDDKQEEYDETSYQ